MSEQTISVDVDHGTVSVGFQEFMLRLKDRDNSEQHAILTGIYEREKARADRAEAALEIVRAEIKMMFTGQYMPTPATVIAALYPPNEDIEAACK